MSSGKSVKVEPKEEPIPSTNNDHPITITNNDQSPMSASNSNPNVTNSTSNKRPRRFKMCLLFQQAEVGPIIGKSGANIKAIKQNCGCDLNFYDLYQRNRTLVILGEKPNIPVAIELIASALKEDDQNKGVSSDSNGAVNGEKNSRVSIFWILQRDQAISLIGKDGANSKRVRDETLATVSVLFGDDQSSPELLVRITGTPKEIANAVQLCIDEFIKDQGKYGGRVQLRSAPAFDGFRRRLIGQGSRGFRYTPSKYRGPDQFKIESTQTIQLPRDLAGAVIGKGGGNITRIRNISGANIKINTPEKEDDLATVVVVGRPSSVAVAFELIEECIQIFLAHGVRLKAAAAGNDVDPNTQQLSVKSVNGSNSNHNSRQRRRAKGESSATLQKISTDSDSKENTAVSSKQ